MHLVALTVFSVLFNFCKGQQTTGVLDVQNIVEKKDAVCFEGRERGPCRARLIRHFYNRTSDACEEFTYGGCQGNGNRFLTRQLCERACIRDEVSARSESLQTCSFEVHMLGSCQASASLSNLTLCGTVPLLSGNQTKCLKNGCCWHPLFKFCHQTVETKLLDNPCRVIHGDNNGLVVVAAVQSPRNYTHGWVGFIELNKPIHGQYCLLKDPLRENTIKLGNNLENGRMIIVHRSKPVFAGNKFSAVLAASYEQDTSIKGKCV